MENKSKIQVLLATMNQTNDKILKKMNIQTDIIVCNQISGLHDVKEYKYNNYKVNWYNFSEKGVGLNRNNALMRASAEYCLIADDDMVYVDGYDGIVYKAFEENPTADVIIFNLVEDYPTRYIIKRKTRINYFNYLRYGTARIAFRLEKVKENGIFFNLCFGGGTQHSHGEDNLFLTDCLKKGLKIYAIPVSIAKLTEERPSTWKTSFNEKYLVDQGILYRTISRKYWKLLCFQDAIRHKKKYKMGAIKAYRIMTSKNTKTNKIK